MEPEGERAVRMEVWVDARVLQDAFRRGNSFQSVHATLERPGVFKGRYHVLGGAISPMVATTGPNQPSSQAWATVQASGMASGKAMA